MPVATLGSLGSNRPTECASGFFRTFSNLSTTFFRICHKTEYITFINIGDNYL